MSDYKGDNMAFNPLTDTIIDNGRLEQDRRGARQIGVIRFGNECLHFKAGFKNYYVPYDEIKRAYRRVMGVPAKMCCGKGELRVESIVICDDNNELAVIQTPGERAAKEVIVELKDRAKNAVFTVPDKPAPEADIVATEDAVCESGVAQ